MAEVVELWTDGACSGNPGPGGWGAILIWNDHERELSGGEADTTNNRMELMSVIMGLAAITRPMDVVINRICGSAWPRRQPVTTSASSAYAATPASS